MNSKVWDLEQLAAVLVEVARGNCAVALPRTGTGDEHDAIAFLVNNMAEELGVLFDERDAATARLAGVLEAMPELVLLLAGEEVVLANATAHTLLGVPPGSLLGRSIGPLLADGPLETGKGAAVERTKRFHTLGGGTVALATTVRALPGTSPARRVVVGRDRRALVEAERLRRVHSRLSALGQLGAGIAHELNNPLGALTLQIGFLTDDLASGPVDRDEVLEMLQLAGQSVDRMARIIESLRSLSGADTGPSIARLVLSDLLDDVFRITRPTTRHAVEVTRAPTDATVLADRTLLVQILVNLVVNAAQACPPRTPRHTVAVSTIQVGNRVEVRVTDDGPGVAASVRDRLFQPFASTKDGGMGLGLALSAESAQAMRGALRLEASSAEGTTFLLTLPAGPAAPHAPTRSTAQGARRDVPGRILVVDDEPMVRHSTAQLLSRAGADVRTASSGNEARALLGWDHCFDAVVCDLMMRDGDGRSLLEWVRSSHPGLATRWVMVTGGAVQPGLLHGVDVPVLRKPYGSAQLLDLLAELLRPTGAG